MPKSQIQTVYRAVIDAEASVPPGMLPVDDPIWGIAEETMSQLETQAEAIASRHGVTFESQNTQALWQGSFRLEAESAEVLRNAVEEIEAVIDGAPNASVLAAE